MASSGSCRTLASVRSAADTPCHQAAVRIVLVGDLPPAGSQSVVAKDGHHSAGRPDSDHAEEVHRPHAALVVRLCFVAALRLCGRCPPPSYVPSILCGSP
jgi:hypothetical protein